MNLMFKDIDFVDEVLSLLNVYIFYNHMAITDKEKIRKLLENIIKPIFKKDLKIFVIDDEKFDD